MSRKLELDFRIAEFVACRSEPFAPSFRRVSGNRSGEEPAMGSSSVRERIAIVFMTLSVVATLVLGGALAAQLGHPKDQVVQVGAAAATSPDGVAAGDQSAAAAATAAATGAAATAAGP